MAQGSNGGEVCWVVRDLGEVPLHVVEAIPNDITVVQPGTAAAEQAMTTALLVPQAPAAPEGLSHCYVHAESIKVMHPGMAVRQT